MGCELITLRSSSTAWTSPTSTPTALHFGRPPGLNRLLIDPKKWGVLNVKQGETSVAARTENQIPIFTFDLFSNELHSLKLVIFAAENGWLELEYLWIPSFPFGVSAYFQGQTAVRWLRLRRLVLVRSERRFWWQKKQLFEDDVCEGKPKKEWEKWGFGKEDVEFCEDEDG